MATEPKTFVRDRFDGHKAEHCARLDTPTHFGCVEMRKSRKGGVVARVTTYSLMLRSRSELVVSL